jgi:hypothetical protein
MKTILTLTLLITITLLSSLPVAAEPPEPWEGRGGRHGGRWLSEPGAPPPPFGGYCPRRHPDRYGARQPLRTTDEARERLGLFFKIPPSQITLRKELRMGYIADIADSEGRLTDRVIIDKRTGRIRSIR